MNIFRLHALFFFAEHTFGGGWGGTPRVCPKPNLVDAYACPVDDPRDTALLPPQPFPEVSHGRKAQNAVTQGGPARDLFSSTKTADELAMMVAPGPRLSPSPLVALRLLVPLPPGEP